MHGIYFRISDGHVPAISTLCGPADVRCHEGRLIRTRQMENYSPMTLNFHLLQKALPLDLIENFESKVAPVCIKHAGRDLPYFLAFPTPKFISTRGRLQCTRYVACGGISDLSS